MKKIHLIRHAKSSWSDPSLDDKQRPLNKRGMKSCGVMARHILNAVDCTDHIYCSPAVRAQQTIELINRNLKKTDLIWQLDERLYTFDSHDLLSWFMQLSDSISEIVVVGHNPALTDLVNNLTDDQLSNITTCAYVQLVCDTDRWDKLTDNPCELMCLMKPRMFTGR